MCVFQDAISEDLRSERIDPPIGTSTLPAIAAGRDQCPLKMGRISRVQRLPSGKLFPIYGKSHFFMGKSTISMAIFNFFVCFFFVCLPEGKSHEVHLNPYKST